MCGVGSCFFVFVAFLVSLLSMHVWCWFVVFLSSDVCWWFAAFLVLRSCDIVLCDYGVLFIVCCFGSLCFPGVC